MHSPRGPSRGDHTIPPRAIVTDELHVAGVLTVGEAAVLEAPVSARLGIVLGQDVRVLAPISTEGALVVGPGATLGASVLARKGILHSSPPAGAPAPAPERKRALLLAGGATAPPPDGPHDHLPDDRRDHLARMPGRHEHRAPAPMPPPRPPTPATERPAHHVTLTVPVDVPTRHVDDLLDAFAAVGWIAKDTGKTVSTDDDEDSLTTLLVEIPEPGRPVAGPAGKRATGAPAEAPAVLRGALHAVGDLHVGTGVDIDVGLTATGDVVIGRDSIVSGIVRAGGAVRLDAGARVGDVMCGGVLWLAEDAGTDGLVEATQGIEGPGARDAQGPAGTRA